MINGQQLSYENKKRFLDIDRAKGLAIILVVIGHISDTAPPGNEWYGISKSLLYSFHMAFFMFLSGYVMYLSSHPLQSITEIKAYIGQRFIRLIVPFLFFGVLLILGKNVIGQGVTDIINPTGFLNDFYALLLYPTDSIARSLWYIYVLFIFSVFFPLIMRISGGRIEYWLPIGIFLSLLTSFVPVSHFLALHRACAYFVFILAGAVAAKRQTFYLTNLDKWGWIWLCFFAISLCCTNYTFIPLFVTGILSIPALHYLVRKNPLAKSDLLLTLGTFVFPIYLMNTIFIGSFRVLILKFVIWNDWHFLIIFPILVVVGLAGPVLVYRAVGHRHSLFPILLGGPR